MRLILIHHSVIGARGSSADGHGGMMLVCCNSDGDLFVHFITKNLFLVNILEHTTTYHTGTIQLLPNSARNFTPSSKISTGMHSYITRQPRLLGRFAFGAVKHEYGRPDCVINRKAHNLNPAHTNTVIILFQLYHTKLYKNAHKCLASYFK